MRQTCIAGNWKMHKTIPESVELASTLVRDLAGGPHRYVIAPTFTALDAVSRVVSGTNVVLAAQNTSTDEKGAHTGEVSVLQLKDIGVSLIILGHSECRHIYKEDDDMINRKVKLALAHGFEVILCVGEHLEEREAGKVEAVCGAQVRTGLSGVTEDQISRVIIAYEPVWAIGTGKNASPQDADKVHSYIRGLIADMYGRKAGEGIVILYGGSMKPDNAASLLSMPNIDGGLIGGASLQAQDFVSIARSV